MTEQTSGLLMERRRVLQIAASLAVAGLTFNKASAQSPQPFKIGVLSDMSGPFSDLTGKGSVTAAKLAVEDFGSTVLGRPIEIVAGDHQNKADIGVGIAREWFGPGKVSMITDFANSSVALGVLAVLPAAQRLAIYTSVSSSGLTGKDCNKYGIHWAHDVYSMSVALMKAMLADGVKSFYFITADYTFGTDMEATCTAAIEKAGGKVLGSSRHPINNADFSSLLLSARSSGAEAIVFATGGNDVRNALKQAAEFGMQKRQRLVTPLFMLLDVHSLGLEATQGLTFIQSWYWDENDETRALAKRYFDVMGSMPSDPHVATYSGVLEYLRAVDKAGTDEADKVLAVLHDAEFNDGFVHGGRLRSDNKMVYERLLVNVKSPAESTKDWDYYTIVRRIPADEAFRPIAESACPLAKA
ncbi:ABC transporter substrate-binding protein [Corticibacterium sp. UT-5YL-CI-8]|nr:ABC transporter substrate-binding protein [Tianweitania sp. UT-5YL-CI-8]